MIDVSEMREVATGLIRVGDGLDEDCVVLQRKLRVVVDQLKRCMEAVREGEGDAVDEHTGRILHSGSSWFGGFAGDSALVDRVNAIAKQRFGVGELVTSTQMDVVRRSVEVAAWLHLEQEGAPKALLAALSGKEELSSKQERGVATWLGSLERFDSQVDVGLLHRGLKGLGKLVAWDGEELWELEWQLVRRGCGLLWKACPRHREWVASCVEEGRVQIGNQWIEIGDRLDGLGVDAYRVHGVEGQSVLFGRNSCELMLRKRKAEEEAWGIPCGSGLSMTDDGRVGLVSQPTTWLCDVEWKSACPKLDEADLGSLRPLCDMLKWFVSEEAAPKGIELKDLYYVAGGGEEAGLCTVKPYRKGWLDWVALERLVDEACDGNRYVYRHVMGESGLEKHPAAQFLRWVVERALEVDDRKIDWGAVAADRQIGDGRLVKLAERWAEEGQRKLRDVGMERARVLAELYPPRYWR